MDGLSRRHFLTSSGVAAGALATAGSANAQAGSVNDNSLYPSRPVTRGDTGALPPFAVRILNKAAYGPARGNASVPNSVAYFNSLGGNDAARLQAWVNEQLNPTAVDPEVTTRMTQAQQGGQYNTLSLSDTALWIDYVVDENDETDSSRPFSELDRVTYLRGAYSRWQFREVISDFWNNHFHVYSRTNTETRGYMPAYERALRGNAAGNRLFGNFYDMLLASAQNAAMMYFLDNYRNSWPNPNENYAREVLELHTLGAIENYYGTVDPATVPDNMFGQRAGYTEIDVFQFARALTGWGTADGRNDDPLDNGTFLFRPDRHYDDYGSSNPDLGPIRVLDTTINGPGTQNAPTHVTDILHYLAEHFGTARFIATKLCQRLVGDNPSAGLVQSTALEFYNRRNDSDQLREVYRHVLMSAEFQNSWGEKARRPLETMLRAWRAADIDFIPTVDRYLPGTSGRNNNASTINDRLETAGQRPWNIEFPTGYPDFGGFWRGTGTLVGSWRLVTRLLNRRHDNGGNIDDGYYLNLAEQVNALIPSINNRTPTQIANDLAFEMLGFDPDSGTLAMIRDFIATQAGVGVTQPLGDASYFDSSGNNTYQRLMRATAALIILLPVGQRR